MTDLRERLRATDPARAERPLDEGELVAMRRAMREAHRRGVPAWKPATALAAAAACLLIGVLLWPSRQETPAPVAVQPFPVAVRAPSLPVHEIVVPEVAAVRPRRAVPPPMPPPSPPSQVREVRFVTASGTQIVWTFRASEEGA